MQTFLPYSDFKKSANVLDRQRLGKQRVEARQILEVLLDIPNKNGKKRTGWLNHPAVLMWRGSEYYLCLYGLEICEEWIRRGYQDNQRGFFENYIKQINCHNKPKWLGDEAFHRSHQSNLLRKNFSYYEKFFPGVPNDLPYIWLVNETQ